MSNTALTKNVFYTCQQYIDDTQTTNQVAQTDDRLQFSFIDKGSDYNLAISKAEIPINNIPLTSSNIPLKKWEISLVNGEYEGRAFVRQLNSTNRNVMWDCDESGLVKQFEYNKFGLVTLVATIDLSDKLNGVSQFLVDSYANGYFLSGDQRDITVINLDTRTVLTSLSGVFITCIAMDRFDKLYVSDETLTSSVVNVYLNQNNSTSVTLTLLNIISLDKSGVALHDIRTISADNVLLVVSHPNEINIYSISSFEPISSFVNSSIRSIGHASSVSASGESTGSFVICDDGFVSNLFVASKSPAVTGNLYNAVTATQYGLPQFNLSQTWNTNSKVAFGLKGYGVNTSNDLISFEYDHAIGIPTSQCSIINSTVPVLNCFLGSEDSNVMVNSTSDKLYGLNLDNLGQNNLTPIDLNFMDGINHIISCDFQRNSKNVIAINSNNDLLETSHPIYAKNIVLSRPVSDSSPSSVMSSIGFGWNKQGTNIQSTDTIESVQFTEPVLIISNQVQDNIGNLCFLCANENYNKIIYTNIHGTILYNFVINSSSTATSLATCSSGSIAVLLFDGYIRIYSISGGAQQSFINTGITSSIGDQAFMFGGRVSTSLYILAVTKGNTITIFGSSDGINYSQIFYTPNVTIGALSPMLYTGCVYTDTLTSQLIIVSSGTNGKRSLTKLVFNSNYTSIVSAQTLVDGLDLCCIDGSITADYFQGCVYVQNGTYDVGTGHITEFNISNNSITSDITIDGYLQGMVNPICSTYHGLGWYNFLPISTTGFTGNMLSIAVSQHNPNRLYILSSNGKVYTGILNNFLATMTEFTQIVGNTDYKSISLSPKYSSYDGVAYLYDIQTQNLISSRSYPGQNISSIAKNDIHQSFAICVENSKIDFVQSASFDLLGTSQIATNFIYTKNSEDLSAGNYDIYDFQAVIDQVNFAFVEAYERLKSAGGHMIQAPKLEMNYITCMMTLNMSADWAQTTNAIRFNDALLRLFKFYSMKSLPWNELQIPIGSTSITQTQKSAYLFNQLVKILFVSDTLGVIGSFIGPRGMNQVISDIDVTTSDYVNNSTTLYYQPTFLRCYQISTNTSINRIQLRVLYQYADGSEHVLYLQPGDSWNAKLQFVKMM